MDTRKNVGRLIALLIVGSFFLTMISMPSGVQAVPKGWDSSTTLMDTGSGAAQDSQIAMDNSGHTIVVWQQVDGSGHQSIYANRLSGGVWGATVGLEGLTGNATNPQIAMDSGGIAVAVWQQVDGSGHQSIYANRLSGGVWGTAKVLETGNGDASSPQVAMDSNGNAMVVWQQVDSSGNHSILANRYSDGVWGGSKWLEAGSGDASNPQIAMDNNGNAMVVWEQKHVAGPWEISARHYSAGVWGAVTWLNYAEGPAHPEIAMDNNGNTMVVWSVNDYPSRSGIYARCYSTSAWEAVTWLKPVESAGSSHVAMDTNGNAVVVWKEVNSTGQQNMYAKQYFSGAVIGPSLTITAPTAGVYLRIMPVKVQWTGSDSGSGISNYGVKLDSGVWVSVSSTANGYSFFNVAQGKHTVSVKATDKGGNYITASVTFTVDTISPSLKITSPPQNAHVGSTSVTINWAGSDAGSGIATCAIEMDKGAWAVLSGTTNTDTFKGLSQGTHTVSVMATDKAGNTKSASVTFRV
jgi:hypothetical protein